METTSILFKHREKEFKLFDIKHKEFRKDIDYFFLIGAWIDKVFKIDNSKQIIVLDYVDKRDSANNKIFEGDILKYNFSSQVFMIQWDEDQSAYVKVFADTEEPKLLLTNHNLEYTTIIGNIFENPELMAFDENANDECVLKNLPNDITEFKVKENIYYDDIETFCPAIDGDVQLADKSKRHLIAKKGTSVFYNKYFYSFLKDYGCDSEDLGMLKLNWLSMVT